MAAGKSTFAQQLSSRKNLLLLSEDELLATLYPDEVTDITAYADRSGRLKSALETLIVNMLAKGISIVMDFPANTTTQRSWLTNLAKSAGADHELYFLDVPDSICKAQLKKRAVENPDRAATDTEEMFDAITRYFEAPQEAEELNITRIEPASR